MAFSSKRPLSTSQKQIYQAESAVNFRFLFSLLSRQGPTPLGQKDVLSDELVQELSNLSQFAEVACCSSHVSPGFLFQNLSTLQLPGFPLDVNYPALSTNDIVVSAFQGSVADLSAYCLYRPTSKQLVIAISGTSTPTQALYAVRFLKESWPCAPGAQIHTGFALLYQGVRAQLKVAVKKGMSEHEVSEVVLCGHSMGGALAYLLTMDLLDDPSFHSQRGLSLKILTLGAPRAGNQRLVDHYRRQRDAYRSTHNLEAIKEYPIRIWNDGKSSFTHSALLWLTNQTGVPSLPPQAVGFAHFSENPFYYIHEQLYAIPPSEGEYTSFRITDAPNRPLKFPRGGHNYYHDRDMERFIRRMNCLVDSKVQADAKGEKWEDVYIAKVKQMERGLDG